MHPFYLFFFFFLVLSISLTASLDNWLTIWLSLEFNTLVFIPLLLLKKSKMTSESAMKYFIVQALASIMMLMIIVSSMTCSMDMMIIPLMMKMGAAPLHQWLPLLSEGLSWGQMWVLLTIQKVNPLILLSSIKMFNVFLMFIILSAVVGSLMGLIQYSLRKLMAYSAISNVAWGLSACLLSNSLLMIYFLTYSVILLSLFLLLKYVNMNFISQLTTISKFDYYSVSMGLLSLGGLPPFTGFIPKMVIILELLKMDMGSLVILLVFSAFLSLFFYMRVILMSVFYVGVNFVFFIKTSMKSKIMLINMIINIIPTPFMMSMYKL